MSNVPPEFPRRVSVNRIGAGGLDLTIQASGDECRALANRLQLPAVASLICSFRLEPALRGQIAAVGELRAEVTQLCVISLEPFEATVHERFAVRFVSQDGQVAGREEDEIDPDAPDELAFSGDMIDLGETASEQLALALDPYPRMPGVLLPPEVLPPEVLASEVLPGAPEGEAALPGDGPVAADERAATPHPFAALARLRGTGGSGNA